VPNSSLPRFSDWASACGTEEKTNRNIKVELNRVSKFDFIFVMKIFGE
jgi:hypothetical protein